MAQLNNSIVHLTMRFNTQVLSIGTGFLYEHAGQFFIITAWHNVTGRNAESYELLSKRGATPNNLVASIALTTSHGPFRVGIEIPLVDDDRSLYFIHPNNFPKIDVVAIPLDPAGEYRTGGQLHDGRTIMGTVQLVNDGTPGVATKLCPVQQYSIVNAEMVSDWFSAVDVSDELFIPGYPKNVRDDYGQPVWKRATVASSVQAGWNRQPKFLIDSASRSGMSGAPVVYYNASGKLRVGMGTTAVFNRPVAILAGVYVGRIGNGVGSEDENDEAATNPSDLDAQLGIVWHASVIKEIVENGQYERLPDDILVSSAELESVVMAHLAQCPQSTVMHIANPEATTRYYARNAILADVDGRAKPKDVLEALMNAVKTYDGPYAPEME